MIFTSLTHSLVDQIWKEVTQLQKIKNQNQKSLCNGQTGKVTSSSLPLSLKLWSLADRPKFGHNLKEFVVHFEEWRIYMELKLRMEQINPALAPAIKENLLTISEVVAKIIHEPSLQLSDSEYFLYVKNENQN